MPPRTCPSCPGPTPTPTLPRPAGTLLPGSGLQRELTALLQRKSSWGSGDLTRFADLCRGEHEAEAELQQTKVGGWHWWRWRGLSGWPRPAPCVPRRSCPHTSTRHRRARPPAKQHLTSPNPNLSPVVYPVRGRCRCIADWRRPPTAAPQTPSKPRTTCCCGPSASATARSRCGAKSESFARTGPSTLRARHKQHSKHVHRVPKPALAASVPPWPWPATCFHHPSLLMLYFLLSGTRGNCPCSHLPTTLMVGALSLLQDPARLHVLDRGPHGSPPRKLPRESSCQP